MYPSAQLVFKYSRMFFSRHSKPKKNYQINRRLAEELNASNTGKLQMHYFGKK